AQVHDVAVPLRGVHRDDADAAAALRPEVGDRGALAVAVGADGEHFLILGLDHIHADHRVAFAQLDAAHAARVTAHAPHLTGVEADRHAPPRADDDVLLLAAHARGEQLVLGRERHTDDAGGADVLVRAERR